MKEYVEKDAVLGCFHDWIDQYGDIHTVEEIPEYRAIEALPSVGGWIPCNETIDIPNYEILACDKYRGMIIGYLRHDKQWVCESDAEIMYDVTAWMPLPAPYQKKDTGK